VEIVDLAGMGLDLRWQIVHSFAFVPTGQTTGRYCRVGYDQWFDWHGFGLNYVEGWQEKLEAYESLSRSWRRIKPPGMGRQ
jgi:hypothetical protein